MDYIRLIIMAGVPILLTILFDTLERKSNFAKIPYWGRQVIIGIVFGISAILATEFGINVGGATTNVRDAAPVCAGLFFGAPAGIIAGLIGGIERWFACLWGAGTYTRLACTISTICAGLYAALIRKKLCKDNRPAWPWAVISATVVEIFHMLMIFFTNMNDISQAFVFVRLCSAPMIILNTAAVTISVVLLEVMKPKEEDLEKPKPTISKIFQRWLLLCLVISFAIITGFIWMLQTRMAESSSADTLKLNMEDVKNDVTKASNNNMLNITRRVANTVDEKKDITNEELASLCDIHDVSEINVIRNDGIIIISSTEINVGFDMWSGEQSSEFMSRIKGSNEYVQEYRAIARDNSVGMKYSGVVLKNGYFVQVGYDAKKCQEDIESQLVGITENRHIGQRGFVAICDENDVIITDANNDAGKTLKEIGIELSTAQREITELSHSRVGNEDAYIMCENAEGFLIVSVYYMDEVILERDMSAYIIIFMEIILLAVLFVDIYMLLNRRVVKDVDMINAGLAEITAGNLDVVLEVNDSEEFAQLSKGINQTVDTLKEHIAAEKARLDKDLDIAKAIQRATLPSVYPHYVRGKAFDLFTSMDAAKEVGGDFYDFYMLDKKHFVFLIADVSGKGVPAAMFMMTSKTQIKSLAQQGLSPSEIFTEANEAFCENNEAGMFVTAWLGILDIETGIVTYVNAGHNPPVIKQNGEFNYFKMRPGFVLAGMEGIKYKQGEIQLQPGDMIYLYTDGVTESTNINNELFGEDRLLETLKKLDGLPVEEMGKGVKADVDAFAGEAPQFDDITMLLVKYKGGK